MDTFADPNFPTLAADSRPAPPDVSVARRYMLRAGYLLLVVGLGAVVWPLVLNHSIATAQHAGIRLSLLAGIGATAVLGLRYPVRMLPLLMFELTWKAIYLTAFALPLWTAGQVDDHTWEDIQAVLVVVVFIPIIPWRYMVAQFVTKRGEPWA